MKENYGVHQLKIPLPFPVASVNSYFFPEPIPTLLDVPPMGDYFMKTLEKRLNAVGSSLAEIRRIIITHPHIDHFGSARDIAEKGGVEIWIHETAAQALEEYEEDFLDTNRFFESLLRKSGIPEELLGQTTRFFDWLKGFACRVVPTRLLKNGDEFRLSSMNLRAVHVPGHTPHCMLFWEPDRKIAFTGDFLLKDISSNPLLQRPWVVPQGYRSVTSHARSLENVRGMKLKVAFPGHGEPIYRPSERITELLRFMTRRKKQIRHILSTGAATPFQIILRLFPGLPPDQLLLALSEVIGYLETFEDEGLVERHETGHGLSFRLMDRQ
ncbi:MAG: Hydroxyacylglutathione hydrolase [Syntrophorhabdus sp. PtaU1.Bin058]|nr:MAG: Hydroxyacylglutathione hydrolase [Syntrophorhabdus sp. PtaU1.Bin058]